MMDNRNDSDSFSHNGWYFALFCMNNANYVEKCRDSSVNQSDL